MIVGRDLAHMQNTCNRLNSFKKVYAEVVIRSGDIDLERDALETGRCQLSRETQLWLFYDNGKGKD